MNATFTAHIRSRIKAAGIKARVRIAPGGGSLQVCVPAYDINFTAAEQREIRFIVKCNKLTSVRGMEIDIERMTDPKQFDFYAA